MVIWDNQSYRRKNRKDEMISMISIEFIECRNCICLYVCNYSTVYTIIGVDPQMTLRQARLSNAQETQLRTLKWKWLFPECISVLSFPSFSVGFTRWRMQGMNRYVKRQREAVFVDFIATDLQVNCRIELPTWHLHCCADNWTVCKRLFCQCWYREYESSAIVSRVSIPIWYDIYPGYDAVTWCPP